MLVFHNIKKKNENQKPKFNSKKQKQYKLRGKLKQKWPLLLLGFIVQWSYQFVSKEIVVPLLEKNCKVITDLTEIRLFNLRRLEE